MKTISELNEMMEPKKPTMASITKPSLAPNKNTQNRNSQPHTDTGEKKSEKRIIFDYFACHKTNSSFFFFFDHC